ncbi:nitroreductase family deazaflavin-dependent oxidoreductase [Actinocorallia sp. API 0066]|uniref:nitroreductase family deazaflavin-dependent oxidoreductase n=1 Tax=Actinocorallia sp. API 0066 TaxID=2896846 RepID=UPI001E490861|nr:nitroreductase family deazaflavin-dependent oxidoreductase [Actinocorallia sp. API 0066]MCD0449081.1 nitroreductase family deazaflavin-dependent oxidoreductase [Actinocorallia sp. API 0066]
MTSHGDYEPSPFRRIRDQVARYEATDGREGGTLEDRPVIILSHRGAKTGKLRKTPLMRIEYNGGYLAVASYGGAPDHPVWYYNLLAHPLVEVRDGATSRAFRAREVSGAEKAELWKTADAAWPHFPEYRARTDRELPVFVLSPTPDQETSDARDQP